MKDNTFVHLGLVASTKPLEMILFKYTGIRTDKLRSGGQDTLMMVKPQHIIRSEWLFYKIEQGGRSLHTIEQGGRLTDLSRSSLCSVAVFNT